MFRILIENLRTVAVQRNPLIKQSCGSILETNGSICCPSRHHFSTQKDAETGKNQGGNKDKKKKIFIPKITLIGQNQSMSITSLEDAQKLAKRRELHLVMVKEMDPKTKRPIYKLETPAERLSEELRELKKDDPSGGATNKTHNKKTEKSLTISARIAEHDLNSRLKHIEKWLTKSHNVAILIQGDSNNSSKSEEIFKTIDKSIKEPETIGKIQQKRNSGGNVKFMIVPVKAEESKATDVNQKELPISPETDRKIEATEKGKVQKETVQSEALKASEAKV